MRSLRLHRWAIVLGLISSAGTAGDAAAPEPGSILIRNVRLVAHEGEPVDVTVSLLLKGGKLDFVTQDEIPSAEAETALDAEGGALLGALNLGEAPTFLILDADPREDFDVLLDTRTHARFAIREGTIIKNALPTVTDDGEAPERRGWLAYTPPPLALPAGYQDTSKWNRWETKHVSGIFTAAIVLDRTRWLSQDSASEEQVGRLDPFTGGTIRGLRFGAVGTLNFEKPWVYTLFGATHAFDKGFDVETTDEVTLFDYRLDIPLPRNMTLSIGKQKEPISLERIMSMIYLTMQERTSVSDAMLASRNVGVVLSGTGLDQRMTWSGGTFNDWFDVGQSFRGSSSQFVGRVTGLPFLTEDESHLLHVGAGIRTTNAAEPLRFRTSPEITEAPDFVDTDTLRADHATTYNLEASWRRGPYWVMGEYVRTDIQSREAGDPTFSGYHASAAWAITKELRPYHKQGAYFRALPVAKTVQQNGPGAWELTARWSDLDLTDTSVEGGEMRIASLGLNWFLTPTFHVNGNYRHIWLDRDGLTGESSGLLWRCVLILE